MVIVVGGVLWALFNLRSWAFPERSETYTLQSQSQEEKEVEVGVGVDCGADGRVRHITWSLMLMYAQWAQNQWCISVSAGSFFPPRWSGREKKGQAHPPHLSSKTTESINTTRFARNSAWLYIVDALWADFLWSVGKCLIVLTCFSYRIGSNNKEDCYGCSSHQVFPWLLASHCCSVGLALNPEIWKNCIQMTILPHFFRIHFLPLCICTYGEVGHRSGSLGLFCGRRPRLAVA